MKPKNRHLMLATVLLAWAARPAAAQEMSPSEKTKPPVLDVYTSEVEVPVEAYGTDGRPITDLQATNLAVSINGVAQEIESVTLTELPYTIGILIDCSQSMRPHIGPVKKAVEYFLSLREHGLDKFLVACFNDYLYPLSGAEPTADRAALTAAVESIRAPMVVGHTALESAVVEMSRILGSASNEGLKKIVLLTDGRDDPATAASIVAPEKMKAALDDGNIVVDVVDVLHMSDDESDGDGEASKTAEKWMNDIASTTGGIKVQPGAYDSTGVSGAQDLKSAYHELFEKTAKQFVLRVSSSSENATKYNTISVTSNGLGSDVRLHYRPGYYASSAAK